MAHGRNKYQSRESRSRIRAVLMQDWDPIGVSGVPDASDEYDAYVGTVYVLLMDQRADQAAIAAYLFDVAVNHMGLPDHPMIAERSGRAAATLGALRPEFEAH